MIKEHKEINVISLGAGVQSSTMALMAAKGLLTPMPDYAIFADTGDEPEEVYKWLDYLETLLPFPVIRVNFGVLSEQITRVRTSKKIGPTFGMTYFKHNIPAFFKKDNGKVGMDSRHCTNNFKIVPIQRELKELKKKHKCDKIIQWIGISVDEAHRMKTSKLEWVQNIYPLVDKNLTRQKCLDWWSSLSLSHPPRSACVFCPYRSHKDWINMKNNHPNDFNKAVEFEKEYQKTLSQIPRVDLVPFIHRSCVPLSEAVSENPIIKDNTDNFGNECEGMCGL